MATLWSAPRARFARDAVQWQRLQSTAKRDGYRAMFEEIREHVQRGGAARLTVRAADELAPAMLEAFAVLDEALDGEALPGLVVVPTVDRGGEEPAPLDPLSANNDDRDGDREAGAIIGVDVVDLLVHDRLAALLRAIDRGRAPPRVVVVHEWGPYRLAWGEAAAALIGRGCVAVVVVPLEELPAFRALLRSDLPLAEIVRALPRSSIVGLATAGEGALSAVRGLLDAPRAGLSQHSIAQTLSLAPRPPRTELEQMMADSARAAVYGLAEHVRAIEKSPPPPLEEGREAIASWAYARVDAQTRTLGAISLLLQAADAPLRWLTTTSPQVARPLSAGVDRPLAMPARGLRLDLMRQGEPVRGAVPPGVPCSLFVSIAFTRDRARAIAPFPTADAIARHGDHDDALAIELVVFARAQDFELDESRERLRLPRFGESEPVRFVITPRRRDATPDPLAPDLRQLRVVAYLGARVLQSTSLAIEVRPDADARADGAAPRATLDFVASDELVASDRGEQPCLSLWVNESPGGTHRIGFHTGEDAPPPEPFELHGDALPVRMHAAMASIKQVYDLAQPEKRVAAERRLVDLATAGADAWDKIFGGARRPNRMRAVGRRLAGFDGLIEINRLDVSAPGLPWQAVYDLPFDVPLAHRPAPQLCGEYVAQVDAARAGGPRLLSPPDCARRAVCPHRSSFAGEGAAAATEAARRTVCPYGFWGARHRMVQPLGDRDDGDDAPAPQSARNAGGQRGLTVGYFEFPRASEHLQRLDALAARRRARVRSRRPSLELRPLLVAKVDLDAIVYFFCHGEYPQGVFHLRVGEAAPLDFIPHRFFMHECQWEHHPVVFLNGCETMTVRPDDRRLHDFFRALRAAGAGAIIGTEVAMFTEPASVIGEAVVEGLLADQPVEAVLLDLRRQHLAEMSVAALAYNVYAPAGFRLARAQ